jgi:hypothetical protein
MPSLESPEKESDMNLHSSRERMLIYAHVFVFHSGFGGLVVSMLVSGTQDRGFVPGRNRWIFLAKNSSACLRWEGK